MACARNIARTSIRPLLAGDIRMYGYVNLDIVLLLRMKSRETRGSRGISPIGEYLRDHLGVGARRLDYQVRTSSRRD